MILMYSAFALSAIATIFISIQLSKYADEIQEQSSVSGVLIGLLLGGATSLPEITTSVTSVIIDSPNLAIGNVLGSNLFNLLILAVLDLVFRKKRMLQFASDENKQYAILVVILSTFVLFSLFFRALYSLFGIGWDTILFVVTYLIGIVIISKKNTSQETKEKKNKTQPSIKKTIVKFSLLAILIMVFGSILTISGDRIAVITGLGSSFVGSFLIAGSTSLPEAVSVMVAIRLKNYNLAIGSILGSNSFNVLILSFTDLIYRKGPLLYLASPSHLITSAAVLLLMFVVSFGIFRPLKNKGYVIPSIMIVIGYFISSYLLFIYK
ncbi:sodium:calcium antiporter [Bacillus sp. CGMCC 1.16541]|uniref:sodium:calcium antiporter n=1 Tax=Bacillus sp. CGMCC 1.16541 TaxID=2185143 RepID=UPI000D73E190|nr:sodium:calcium antiporter [Bacillus sp. CGMCC 1.16541]